MIYRSIAICAMAFLLTACGGGGSGGGSGSTVSPPTTIGGGDNGPITTGNDWLQFSPPAISLTSYEGEATPFQITGTSSKTIAQTLQILIEDRKSVLGPNPNLTALSTLSYQAKLTVSPKLAPGTYTGSLAVYLCSSGTTVCVNPYPGSPWQVPYSITVRPNTNLTPLSALAGAGAWSTFQGNAAHTGYVPATLNPADFNRRFIWKRKTLYPFNQAVSTPAIDNGRACMNVVDGNNTSDRPPFSITCLSEQTGQVLWSSAPANSVMGVVSAVALAQDRLYVTTTSSVASTPTGTTSVVTGYQPGNAVFSGFNAANGSLLFRQKLNADSGASNLPPVPVGNAVYIGGGGRQVGVGAVQSLTKLDAATGALAWTVPQAGGADWTPAWANNRLFWQPGGQLLEADVATGASRLVATNLLEPVGVPVLDGNQAAYTLGGGGEILRRFNLTNGALVWSVSDAFRSSPVLVGDTVYIRTTLGLQARSAASGALLWQWNEAGNGAAAIPANFSLGSLVVVGRHAFVSSITKTTTTAVDLNTRQAVWSDTFAGALSVSANGILYISSGEALVAINLH